MNNVQQQAADMIPFEQTGLSKIRQVNEATDRGCQFQTLLVVQPSASEKDEHSLFNNQVSGLTQDDPDAFSTYALLLHCEPFATGLGVRTSFDSKVLSSAFVRRFIQQFQTVLGQLCRPNLDTKLSNLQLIIEEELNNKWIPNNN